MSEQQRAHTHCTLCGTVMRVTPRDGAPYEFDATCPGCNSGYVISWNHAAPAPTYLPHAQPEQLTLLVR